MLFLLFFLLLFSLCAFLSFFPSFVSSLRAFCHFRWGDMDLCVCVFVLPSGTYWWFKRPPITLLIHSIFFAIFHVVQQRVFLHCRDATYPYNSANQAFEPYHFPFLQVITLVVLKMRERESIHFSCRLWTRFFVCICVCAWEWNRDAEWMRSKR